MPCYYPLPAWRDHSGSVSLREPKGPHLVKRLRLPCGDCVGCRTGRAQEWAIRCTLEEQSHESSLWTTLTYAPEFLPGGLQKRHLSGFLKRLRARVAPRRVRFFASGEYGERFGRPHYHVILFGLPDASQISEAWPYGHARTYALTPALISYTAGYCAKKIGWRAEYPFEFGLYERINYETGEVTSGRYKNYFVQPPFVEMSVKPGIGGFARRHWRSWRTAAIHNGREVPVPRYLHAAWLANASQAEQDALQEEQEARVYEKTRMGSLAPERIAAGAKIAAARLGLSSARRLLG